MNRFLYFLFLLVITLCSCQNNVIYSEFRNFPEKGWNRYDTVFFSIPIKNSDSYKITLESRNNTRYLYQNMWLFVSCRYDSIKVFSDTVQVQLADKMGKWKGSGWGSLYELSIPYKSKFQFPKANKKYTFKIVQGMRDYDLKGVENIGITIETEK